ncbi:MAG: hypothetical protein ACTSSP_00350 [Candidatus Asgardarchaeia archaeon]
MIKNRFRPTPEQELRNFKKWCREKRKEMKDNPEKALELLVRVGICTPTGRLRKPYR